MEHFLKLLGENNLVTCYFCDFPCFGTYYKWSRRVSPTTFRLQNSKAVKKMRPCKVEVTVYPYQKSVAACKRLVRAVQLTCKISIAVKGSMAITAELPSATTSCDIRVQPCVWYTCLCML